jgi:hypothetical protein
VALPRASWNSAKRLPATIERRAFPDTQITAYRLAA